MQPGGFPMGPPGPLLGPVTPEKLPGWMPHGPPAPPPHPRFGSAAPGGSGAPGGMGGAAGPGMSSGEPGLKPGIGKVSLRPCVFPKTLVLTLLGCLAG